MFEDFKSNFITTPEVGKPMAELEELNALVKKKKAEVRKAMFYAKHPDLLAAKKDYDSKIAAQQTDKFNESITEPVKGKEKVKEPEPEPEPVKATVPVASPSFVPSKAAAPQHSHNKPFVVGLNSKWF